jgi:hypothetical protein
MCRALDHPRTAMRSMQPIEQPGLENSLLCVLSAFLRTCILSKNRARSPESDLCGHTICTCVNRLMYWEKCSPFAQLSDSATRYRTKRNRFWVEIRHNVLNRCSGSLRPPWTSPKYPPCYPSGVAAAEGRFCSGCFPGSSQALKSAVWSTR